MILQQQDSICYHTEIKTDLLEIKELCYKNSYMVLTIFELFRNYVQEQKLSFEYSWREKEMVINIKSFDKSLMDDFKEHLPAYLKYAFKDFLTPEIVGIISVHTKKRIQYEDAPDVVAHFKSGMNACRLEQKLAPKQSLGRKPKI